jgi:hypothetical protein
MLGIAFRVVRRSKESNTGRLDYLLRTRGERPSCRAAE